MEQMDAELKAKWVAALRSGEYKQGAGHLHKPEVDAYCCLGVLCKVMGASFQSIEGTDDDGDWYSFNYVPVLNGKVLSSRDDEELSTTLEKHLGIDQATLVIMNDGLGEVGDEKYEAPKPFVEIADYIEKNQ